MDVVVERRAALDVHKRTVMACVRAPDGAGRRRQELREFRAFSRDLHRLRTWLVDQGVTQVAMEATGVFWKRCGTHSTGRPSSCCSPREEPARPQDRRRRCPKRREGPATGVAGPDQARFGRSDLVSAGSGQSVAGIEFLDP